MPFFCHLTERDKHPVTNKTINLADPQALKQNCGEVQSNKQIRQTDLEALRPQEISCCHTTRRATSQDMQLHLVRMLSGLLETSHFQTSARRYTLSVHTPTRAFQYFTAGFMTCPVELAREFGVNWNWTHTGSETNSGDCGRAASNLIVRADTRVGREIRLHCILFYFPEGTVQNLTALLFNYFST